MMMFWQELGWDSQHSSHSCDTQMSVHGCLVCGPLVEVACHVMSLCHPSTSAVTAWVCSCSPIPIVISFLYMASLKQVNPKCITHVPRRLPVSFRHYFWVVADGWMPRNVHPSILPPSPTHCPSILPLSPSIVNPSIHSFTYHSSGMEQPSKMSDERDYNSKRNKKRQWRKENTTGVRVRVHG